MSTRTVTRLVVSMALAGIMGVSACGVASQNDEELGVVRSALGADGGSDGAASIPPIPPAYLAGTYPMNPTYTDVNGNHFNFPCYGACGPACNIVNTSAKTGQSGSPTSAGTPVAICQQFQDSKGNWFYQTSTYLYLTGSSAPFCAWHDQCLFMASVMGDTAGTGTCSTVCNSAMPFSWEPFGLVNSTGGGDSYNCGRINKNQAVLSGHAIVGLGLEFGVLASAAGVAGCDYATTMSCPANSDGTSSIGIGLSVAVGQASQGYSATSTDPTLTPIAFSQLQSTSQPWAGTCPSGTTVYPANYQAPGPGAPTSWYPTTPLNCVNTPLPGGCTTLPMLSCAQLRGRSPAPPPGNIPMCTGRESVPPGSTRSYLGESTDCAYCGWWLPCPTGNIIASDGNCYPVKGACDPRSAGARTICGADPYAPNPADQSGMLTCQGPYSLSGPGQVYLWRPAPTGPCPAGQPCVMQNPTTGALATANGYQNLAPNTAVCWGTQANVCDPASPATVAGVYQCSTTDPTNTTVVSCTSVATTSVPPVNLGYATTVGTCLNGSTCANAVDSLGKPTFATCQFADTAFCTNMASYDYGVCNAGGTGYNKCTSVLAFQSTVNANVTGNAQTRAFTACPAGTICVNETMSGTIPNGGTPQPGQTMWPSCLTPAQAGGLPAAPPPPPPGQDPVVTTCTNAFNALFSTVSQATFALVYCTQGAGGAWGPNAAAVAAGCNQDAAGQSTNGYIPADPASLALCAQTCVNLSSAACASFPPVANLPSWTSVNGTVWDAGAAK